MFPVTCPTCGKLTQAAEQDAGLEAKCPSCGATFVIPALGRKSPRRPPTMPADATDNMELGRAGRDKIAPGARGTKASDSSTVSNAGSHESRRRPPNGSGTRGLMRVLLALAAAVVLGFVLWRVMLRDRPQTDPGFTSHEGVVLRADSVAKTGPAPLPPPYLPDGRFLPDSIALVIYVKKEYPNLAAAKLDLDQEFAHKQRGQSAPANPAIGDTAGARTVSSDDGLHRAHIVPATQPSGAVAAVIVDGTQDVPVNGPITDLQFSPDGRHYAFLVHTGGSLQLSLFVDGTDLKPPLAGKCHGLRYVSETLLRIALGSPDGKVRLMELRLVPVAPGKARPRAMGTTGK